MSDVEEDLKLCFKCGAEAIAEYGCVVCNGCGMWTGEGFDTLEDAAAWWNDQPLNDLVQARINQLEAENDELSRMISLEIVESMRLETEQAIGIEFLRSRIAELERQVDEAEARIDEFESAMIARVDGCQRTDSQRCRST